MGAGKDASTCTIGCAIWVRFEDVPIQIPTGTAQRVESTSTIATRRRVHIVLRRTMIQVKVGTDQSKLPSRKAPQRAIAMNASTTKNCALFQRRGLLPGLASS